MTKKNLTILSFILTVLLVFTNCKNEDIVSPYIDGLSLENYPIIDGSTSTLPLNTVIACELLKLGYDWEKKTDATSYSWFINPKVSKKIKNKLDKRVLSSQTHGAFLNVIDQKAEIAFVARKLSKDEKEYAKSKGVSLIETPIALDAFIFIVNQHNQVKNLTTKNIQDIYTGKETDWINLGWTELDGRPFESPLPIHPYIRNQNSGSQELMDSLIMNGLEYYKQLPIYKEQLIFTMAGTIDVISNNISAIGYTVFFYNEQIIRPGSLLKKIAIDGVFPSKQTITNRSYPYTTEVYAVIRSDMDRNSMAYKVYEWLQTNDGKKAISKSGYIPN